MTVSSGTNPAWAPYADWGSPPLGATDIDDQIIATLQMWMDTYLTQIEKEMAVGAGFFPRVPADHVQSTIESMDFLDVTLPALIVTTAQTQGAPEKTATSARAGVYSANWAITVSSIVRGQDKRQARDNGSNFEKTVRRCLLDQVVRMNGTPITHLQWTGSQVAPVPDITTGGRYLVAGIGKYIASVDEAAHDNSGPVVPDAAPYGELPTVSDTPVDIQPIRIEEQAT